MTTSGNVTVTQDGRDGGERLHPYLIAFVRWCVSCIWSSATLLLHRLMTAPLPALPAITASKSAKSPKARPAGTEHLHPEPLVECVILHQPETTPDMDIIFVHGLYGSLGNTWRQGDWRSKYKVAPNRVSLRRSSSIPTPCDCSEYKPNRQTDEQKSRLDNRHICNLGRNEGYNEVKCNLVTNNEKKCEYNNNKCTTEANERSRYESEINEVRFENIDETFYNYKRILPKDNVFITEKFYENTIINQVEIIDNYEIQANFVRDLFDLDNKFEMENERCESLNEVHNDDQYNEKNDCTCKENNDKCEAGCGCVCDECYSPCWPRDWLRIDYPNARVLSINYTSDPYLWRPLWIKGSKRLHLHERAQQMLEQLLTLGVGQRPIIWVGHSKGGLFIKQIYCEAYEAYLKTKDAKMESKEDYKSEEIVAHDKDKVDLIEIHDNIKYTNENLCLTASYDKNNTKDKHLNKTTREDETEEQAPPNLEENMFTEIYLNKLEYDISSISDENVENSTDRNLTDDIKQQQHIDKKLKVITFKSHQDSEHRNFDDASEGIHFYKKENKYNEKDIDETNYSKIPNRDVGKFSEDTSLIKKLHQDIDKVLEATNFVTNPHQVINNFSENVGFTTNSTQNIYNYSVDTSITVKPPQDISKTTNFNTNPPQYITETKIFTTKPQQGGSKTTNSTTNLRENTDKVTTKLSQDTENVSLLHRDTDELSKDENCINSSLHDADMFAVKTEDKTKNSEDRRVCDIWSNSAGFMFYSVPHRGAALADIITPLTARSTELLEMGKDCSLVLSLHQRWLRATAPTQPTVRSLVETCRTLMSVLWLRIVSVDSADAGVGALCGVSVDHREICKPTSRHCLLYTELLNLINAAINKCTCKK